jgi:hypothetical protein
MLNAEKVKRLSGKICYVFEQIVALRHKNPEISDVLWEKYALELMAEMWELSHHKDVFEIYELFKSISNQGK